MAFGVTEPTAGVDTSRIKTKAEKVDGGWVVNGQKVWISNAQNARKILLLARTSARNEDKPLDGMTLSSPTWTATGSPSARSKSWAVGDRLQRALHRQPRGR